MLCPGLLWGLSALVITLGVDSVLWQRPLWPELGNGSPFITGSDCCPRRLLFLLSFSLFLRSASEASYGCVYN